MGFEKQFLFSNPLVIESAEVVDMYALRKGIGSLRFGFGTAVGIFKSVISISLVLSTNFLMKKIFKKGLF